MNIVITGCFNTSAIDGYGRQAVRSMIAHSGHNVRSELSRNTDYLCVGTANVPGRGVWTLETTESEGYGHPRGHAGPVASSAGSVG